MIRALALLGAAVVVVVLGVTSLGPADISVTASVKTFLLDWEQKNYAAAASMTTGAPAVVEDSLSSVYQQLGAQDLLLGIGPITVTGNHARALFNASFDLGRGGLSWRYRGSFGLRRTAVGWRVVWSPSVIVPGLGAGDRLAVLTRVPGRAVLLDAEGHSLIPPSPVIELGVYPDQVTDPARTARVLARVTGLPQSDAVEMTGQIEAAPPESFLELVQQTPARYRKLRPRLRKVPDLQHMRVIEPLFKSTVPVITGQVATETAKTLVQGGEPYRPGTTIGLTGLQQAFQAKLAGRPTTQILMQNSVGKQIKVLHSWPGASASNVRTTINGQIQSAADSALTGVGLSAAIIAVRAGGGQILAAARQTERGMPTVSPLDGQYQPGQSFTIVSAAALLAARSVTAKSPVTCIQNNKVGNRLFVNHPAEPNLGAQLTFGEAFAHACSTAFAVLSLDLTAGDLIRSAEQFGIVGSAWKLPLPAYGGRMRSPGSDAGQLASDTVGAGSVRVSPLAMALVAGAVESGSWRAPLLVTTPRTQQPSRPKLSSSVDGQLRKLMRATVTSGAARAASLFGAPVSGQVGTAPLAGHRSLRAIWFVGFRGSVAFAVVVFSRSASFAPAVQIAGQFAAALP